MAKIFGHNFGIATSDLEDVPLPNSPVISYVLGALEYLNSEKLDDKWPFNQIRHHCETAFELYMLIHMPRSSYHSYYDLRQMRTNNDHSGGEGGGERN